MSEEQEMTEQDAADLNIAIELFMETAKTLHIVGKSDYTILTAITHVLCVLAGSAGVVSDEDWKLAATEMKKHAREVFEERNSTRH